MFYSLHEDYFVDCISWSESLPTTVNKQQKGTSPEDLKGNLLTL